MQALRKAERAKQSHAPDEELAKPSEAFDDLLALEPQETAAVPPLSLSPLDEPGAQPEPAAEPPRASRNAPPPPMRKAPVRKTGIGMPDPRLIRIAVLCSIALLIAALFAYMYWRAMYGPGSSKHLPMVPMPGQGAPPATAPAPAPDYPPAPGYPPPPPSLAGTPVAPAPVPAATPDAAPPATVEVPVVPYAKPIRPPSAPPPGYVENLTPADYARMDQAQQVGAPDRAAVAAQSAARPSDSGDIRVARARGTPRINPSLQSGYAAFQGGDIASARQHYQTALQQEPNNRDALLGLAAIAIKERQGQKAADLYARLLEADPGDGDALAGLSGLRQAAPGQAEARLRRVLERDPEAASALFALGNLYARQGRWAEAQQQYFRAYTSAPDNADYAFNLAVGLDRLNQGALARDYYQRALTLAANGSVNFDRNAASARVRELGGQ